MGNFTALLQQGNAWLFIPSAILLGALHGLEPGHSKTMMAAFIVAIKGTITQAILLGLCATISHTAVVWAIAMAGLYFGQNWDADTTEPYFQLLSGFVIIAIALWMVFRTWSDNNRHKEHDHHHEHSHDHKHDHHHDALDMHSDEYQDAHERAHAADIKKRFDNREVTTTQVCLFGLTGGLIPCPASITILIICLQLKQFALGATLVLGFSVGLALTLVLSGVIASIGMKQLSSRWGGFDQFTRKAPYFSGVLIILVGLYVGYHGLIALV